MQNRISTVVVVLLASRSLLLADFSYEENARITGGLVAGAMKVAAVFSKQLREPMRSTVAVKGDRMVHLSATHSTIIDVDKETITTVDLQKKTWSVMTFAQMQQALEQMSQKMKQKDNNADLKLKVSVDSTGQTKDINGMPAKELVVKVEMEMTDTQSGQKGSIPITTDTWIVPKFAGYEEVTAFHRKMAEKIAWMPGQSAMGRPEVTKGMVEVTREISKLDGMPVYSTIRMGTAGGPPPQAPQASAPPPDQPKQQAQQPSVGSAIGGALGGRFGLGRKKKDQADQQAAGSQAPAQGDTSGLLMEMVTETTNFSSAPVDPAKFEVPAGFKQVQPDTRSGMR